MKKLFSVKRTREFEQALLKNGETEVSLVERVGEKLFKRVIEKPFDKIIVFVGKGNNGADGLSLADKLLKNGRSVVVVKVFEPQTDASRYFYEKFVGDGGMIVGLDEAKADNSLVVDCIFGIGFKGEASGEALKAINIINESKKVGAYVLSVDIPSGLNGDSGMSVTAVQADETLAVGCLKTGHVLNTAKDHVGKLDLVDINFALDVSVAYLLEKTDISSVLPKRKHFSHKNDFGTVGVFGGSVYYGGAAKLANISACAISSGAGITRLITPKCISSLVAPYLLESTYFPCESNDKTVVFDRENIDLALDKLTALSFGMGLCATDETFKILEYILKNKSFKLCIDADGLNCLSENPSLLDERTTKSVILTPHVGEFCRLSGAKSEDVIFDPIGYAKAFAKEHSVVVLLKGTATVVTDGNDVFISDRGVAGMATAGSGDVLSGVIAGLLGYNELSAFTGACAAFIAGYAAEIASKNVCDISLTSSITAGQVGRAITELAEK